MISFGESGANSLHIGFGYLSYLDSLSTCSILFRARNKDLVPNVATICGQAYEVGAHGWFVRFASVNSWVCEFVWLNGSTEDHLLANTTIVEDTWYSFGIAWNGPGNACNFYLNGSPDGTPTSGSGTMSSSSAKGFAINARYEDVALSAGGAWDLGDLLIFPNTVLTQADMESFHRGMLPDLTYCKFWWPGDFSPGYNAITHASGGQEEGTEYNGTPLPTSAEGAFLWGRSRVYVPAFMAKAGEASAPTSEGLISTTLYNEIIGEGRVYFAFEMDLPDGSVIRRAEESLMTELGLYKMRVDSWGVISKKADWLNPNLEGMSTSLVIADEDREISTLLFGRYQHLLESSAEVRIKLISPFVPYLDWFTAFRGKYLKCSPEGPIPLLAFSLGPNDKPLKSGAKLGVIDTITFPDIDSDVEGVNIRAIYGTHEGIVAYRISTTEFLISAGKCKTLSQVYEDGDISAGSWSKQYSIRRGRVFTEVLFDSNPGDVEITVDVVGIEIFGDGSGSPITNPVDILEHALVNWYYGEYKKGSYYSADDIDAPIYSIHFSESATLMSQYGWLGKRIITAEKTGYQLISDWISSWKIPVIFWGFNGQLAIQIPKFYIDRSDKSQLIEGKHAFSELITDIRDDRLIDRVTMKFDYNEATGQTESEIYSRDQSREYGSEDTITNNWLVPEEE